MKPITAKRHVNPNHQHSFEACRGVIGQKKGKPMQTFYRRSWLLLLLFISPTTWAATGWLFDHPSKVYVSPQLWLGYQYASATLPTDSGQVGGLLPLMQNAHKLLFTQGNFFYRSDSRFDGGAALGYRVLSGQSNLFGVHSGVSLTQSSNSYTYDEAYLGASLWHNRFYIGANGYAPFGTTSNVQGDGYESILAGVDGEVGYTLWHHISAFGGGYYYHRDDFADIGGAKATLEYNSYRSSFFHHLRFYTSLRHDQVFDTSIWAGLQVSFSLAPSLAKANSKVADHLADDIRHEPAMITTDYQGD